MLVTKIPLRQAALLPPIRVRDGIQAEPSVDAADLRITPPKKWAAGLPGVVAALRARVGRDGRVSRRARLLALNQKGGFDCMSCAWADPDGQRHTFEFCENGAKALAWEGDTARVTPDFFREHSVAELSHRSDYWLGQQGRLTEPMVLREGATHYEPIAWDEAFSPARE